MLLAYDDYGPGPVVVLAARVPAQSEDVVGAGGPRGLDVSVIAPDLRGHGESAAPRGVYTMEAMAGDVIELLDALQITEPIVLGGLSMGGYVALALIARDPERVRGLMLIDTRAAADTPEAAPNREDLARKVEASESVEPRGREDVPQAVLRVHAGRPPGAGRPVRAAMEKTPPRGVVGCLAGHGRPARPHEPSCADHRADARHGRRRRRDFTPPDEARKMAEALPAPSWSSSPTPGTSAPFENPDAANEAILQFLAGLH